MATRGIDRQYVWQPARDRREDRQVNDGEKWSCPSVFDFIVIVKRCVVGAFAVETK